jgi:glycosyltransferase involved in cell wall biosynthesis
MNFFFWQNINSILQSSFLNKLAEDRGNNVSLVLEYPLNDFRKNMGWEDPDLYNVQIIKLFEGSVDLESLIINNSTPKDIHIFSGINAFPKVHQAFLKAISRKCRIGIFTEPLDFRGKKGLIRKWRGFYYNYKYSKYIEFIIATGKLGVEQFKLWGYPEKKIFEWAYTVSLSKVSFEQLENHRCIDSFKIMFAGSLIHRKGYDLLLKALMLIPSKYDFSVDLFCLRPNEIEIGKQIQKESGLFDKVSLKPFERNDELRQKMHLYDLFVLPSRHDGWGAVVNESLMEGTKALVSSNCGSSTLVMDNNYGQVIKELNVSSLALLIENYILNGKESVLNKKQNRMWAEKHISGTAMANYFKEIIKFLNNQVIVQPTAPWYSPE